jgi:nitrogen regulatory protein P-II 2
VISKVVQSARPDARKCAVAEPLGVAWILHLGLQRDPRIRAQASSGSPDSRLVRCEMHLMKMITAVVRPFKLDDLRQAIAQLGVQGVTVTEVYETQFGPRSKLEIAVDDAVVEPVLEAIANVSRTGRSGDGRILVGELEQVIRIRTGETGTPAT